MKVAYLTANGQSVKDEIAVHFLFGHFVFFQMKATDVPEIQESGRRLPVTWQTIVMLLAILVFVGASLGLFFLAD